MELKSFTRRWDTSKKRKDTMLSPKSNSKKKKKVQEFKKHDKYFFKAKSENYRARSVYKLIEIQEKFNIIKPKMNICDIWAAPWSFIQFIKKVIKDSGIIVWIDLKKIDEYSQKNIHLIKHCLFEYESLKPKVEEIIWTWNKFDLITSDIAPNTSWRKDLDQFASVELNMKILDFADFFLKKWWNIILKVFKWGDFYHLVKIIKNKYETFTEYKPKACRDRSFEEYIVCFNKK